RRPDTRLGFRLALASVACYDAPNGGKSDSGSLEGRVVVQPLERAEQLARVAHVEADAVVGHEERAFSVEVLRADLHPRIGPTASELERVVDEIVNGNPQQSV